jgi:hypothetical protein
MSKLNSLPKKVKLSLLATASLAALFLASFLLADTKPTRAGCDRDCGDEKLTICHCEGLQCQTIRVSYSDAAWHIRNHHNDHWGACREEPTPTDPTPTPTKPTSTPADPTPTDTPGGGGPSGGGGGPAGAPTCGATVPSAPYLVSATAIGGNKVRLNWQKVANATHYTISYGSSSGNYPWGVPNTGDTDEYEVGSISSGCFVVRAVNDCAPSDPSNEVCTGQVQGQVLGLSSTSGGSNYAYVIIGLASLVFGTKLIRKENFI